MFFPKNILLIVLAFALAGCSTLGNQAKKEEEKQRIEEKKKHFAALYDAISEKQLEQGLSSQEIRERYGEPDNIFRSGSSYGSLEIWTYERVMEKPEQEDWHPIRLYFDNNKLLSWKF